MPTENERKFVLFNEPIVLSNIAQQATRILSIEQAYIQSGKKWNFRIRKTFGIHYDEPIYHATYKHKIGGRVVEIETALDERDYDDLFSQARTVLNKTRYVIPAGSLRWEIDFFYDVRRSNVYFVLAEVELPENVSKPPYIPSIIQDHLLFEVPEDDNNFSSVKLTDMEYAIEKYDLLTGGNYGKA